MNAPAASGWRAFRRLLLAALTGFFVSAAALAGGPVDRAKLVGVYYYLDGFDGISLQLETSGAYSWLHQGDFGLRRTFRGSWHLDRNGEVSLRGDDEEAERTAQIYGPFTPKRSRHGAWILISKKQKGADRKPARFVPGAATPAT